MSTKLAIVGMELFLGPDEGLDAFDRTIFDGLRHSAEEPREGREKERAGTGVECKEGCLRLLDRSSPPDALSLLRTAVDRSLRSASPIPAGQEGNRFALIVVSGDGLQGLEKSPERTVRADSVPAALKKARDLLSGSEVQGVVVGISHFPDGSADGARTGPGGDAGGQGGGLPPGRGAGAVFLKGLDQAEKDRCRIFATIDAIATETNRVSNGERPSTEAVEAAAGRALRTAGVRREEIACIECPGWEPGEGGPQEVEGLAGAYGSKGREPTCALGSIRANVGDGSVLGGLAGIIKAALCLYHRYIPATPGWTGPGHEASWGNGPFYVPTESRPWFLDRKAEKRSAAVSCIEGGIVAHLVLSEDVRPRSRPNRYLELVSPFCFPLAGSERNDFTEGLESLERSIEAGAGLMEASRRALFDFQEKPDAAYALVVVGHNREELIREIRFMKKGVPQVFEKGAELRTPKGSYFTASPLGREGKVAFVYPGVGSAYVGLGRSLFHLFPDLHESVPPLIPDLGGVLQERDLYPRTVAPLSEEEIWKRELRLRRDILSIGECGTGFFVVFTTILRDAFKVEPHCAFGYSLGEPGMLAALGVWDELGTLSERSHDSPTFQENLSGAMTTVRKLWNLPEEVDGTRKKAWETFTLQAAVDLVEEAVECEERVYLTIINAPEEVVIAGDPESCRRVIKKIGCKHYPLGLNLALHCPPTEKEYDRIVDLYTLPVQRDVGIKFYSSSCYKPIPLRSKAVAHSIAKAYSDRVDFPRLVNRVYEDGARLFIELGSRKFCSNLIDRILEGRDHLAMAVNVKGTKDQASLVRVLAQLVSHRVPVDLSPFFHGSEGRKR